MKDVYDFEWTIEKYHDAIRKNEITAVKLVEYYLDRIAKFDNLINSIISINPKAIDEAQKMDEFYEENGFFGKLHGVPVLVKDNIDVQGMPTTAGSLSLKDVFADEDAYIIKMLKREGAIIIAKTNLHEFAIWGETISSILGQTYNPYDLTRTPGGSSGGTGAAVAFNFGIIGLGTDTINSVRSPASANNLVGIRPTMGFLSRGGIIPYSYTQDTAGPIARTVEDAVKCLDVIKGYDSSDPITAWGAGQTNKALCDHLKKDGANGKRIGVLRNFFGEESIHADVTREVEKRIDDLSKLGATLIEINDEIDSEHLVKEVSVHLYDLKDHLNQYFKNNKKSSGVKSFDEIVESGLYHPGIEENLKRASGLSTESDEYYKRMYKREQVKTEIINLIEKYELDALVYPHQKQLTCSVGGSQNERNGVLASVTGFPSICIPAGFSEPSDTAPIGVPIGLELMGRPFSEDVLIEIAYSLEQYSMKRKSPLL